MIYERRDHGLKEHWWKIPRSNLGSQKVTFAPVPTHTDTGGRLQLKYTLINGNSFLNMDEPLIRKQKAHKIPSKHEDIYCLLYKLYYSISYKFYACNQSVDIKFCTF